MFEDRGLPTAEERQRIIEKNRDETIARAREVYHECKDTLKSGIADVIYFEGSPGEKFLGITWRGMVDRFGQVYMTISGYLGAGVGFGGVGGIKLFGNKDNAMNDEQMISYITGWGGGFTLYGGIGGGLSIGRAGGSAEIGLHMNISANLNFGWTEKIYDL